MIARYIATRIGYAVFVVWAAFTVSFLLLYVLPSDAVALMLGRNEAVNGESATITSPEVEAILRSRYGLDQPLLTQYFVQLGNFIRGDFGVSIRTGLPVSDMIAQSMPWTVQLTLVALVVSILLAIVIATLAVLAPFGWLRQLLASLPALGASLPSFWLGILLLQVFSFQLGWFPAMGNTAPGALVLPVIAIALPGAAGFAQVLFKSMTQASRAPFADTARAKGLSAGQVHTRHVFRNSIIPTLTMIGLTLGGLFSGSVVVETVFSRDGIGRIAQQAVDMQDTAVVLAIVVLAAVVTTAANLAVDLVYPLIDPRIRRAGMRTA